MLNEQKIRIMTDLAMYEKKNESSIKIVNTSFKSDYISRNVIRGFIGYTLSFLILAALRGVFLIDTILSEIDMDVLHSLLVKAGIYYVIGFVIYFFLNVIVYGRRYDTAKSVSRVYLAKLKHLDKEYKS